MDCCVGIDVSLRSCAVCIVDGKGAVLFERELPCEIEDINECLSGFPHDIERFGFEAGTLCGCKRASHENDGRISNKKIGQRHKKIWKTSLTGTPN